MRMDPRPVRVRVGRPPTGHSCTVIKIGARAGQVLNRGIVLKKVEIYNGRNAETDA
jgi:hypothetical protein